jgi:formylmethanofuran dehydrogenase subunit E
MNKIIIDMPTPELTKAVEEKIEEIFYDFKCVSCGEKFADEWASDDDVALCKWCNGEEE